MAPEVIDCGFREGGSTYDSRIDVWALGKKEDITKQLTVLFPPFEEIITKVVQARSSKSDDL
jgi:hypothetical protein